MKFEHFLIWKQAEFAGSFTRFLCLKKINYCSFVLFFFLSAFSAIPAILIF